MNFSNQVFLSTIVKPDYRLRHQLPRGEGLEFASPFIFSIGGGKIAF